MECVVIGGGLSVEGEAFLQHVTAPAETQVTNTTQTLGQVMSNKVIGHAIIPNIETGPTTISVPVVASGGSAGSPPLPDTIATYPHTHSFNNIPLTLTDTNESTRNSAKNQGINSEKRVIASPQFNTLKSGITIDAAYVESLSGVGGVGTEREEETP